MGKMQQFTNAYWKFSEQQMDQRINCVISLVMINQFFKF